MKYKYFDERGHERILFAQHGDSGDIRRYFFCSHKATGVEHPGHFRGPGRAAYSTYGLRQDRSCSFAHTSQDTGI